MKNIILKPSTTVQEVADFFAENFPDEVSVGIKTLKGNAAGTDRKLRALTEKDLTGGVEVEVKNTIEDTITILEKLTGLSIYSVEVSTDGQETAISEEMQEAMKNKLLEMLGASAADMEDDYEGEPSLANRIISIKPSSTVQFVTDFFADNYPDNPIVGILTLKGSRAGADRKLRALSENNLSGGIEIELSGDIEEAIVTFTNITGLNIWRGSSFSEDDESNNELLNDDELLLFMQKIADNNIFPQLPFVFDEILAEHKDELDKHYPFFFIEDVIIANRHEGFIYANIDGIFSNCIDNEVRQILSWDSVDDVYYVDDEGTREHEPDHLTILTLDENLLSISKDTNLNFISAFWNCILKDIVNEFRDEPAISWTVIEEKLNVVRVVFNSWDEIRDYLQE